MSSKLAQRESKEPELRIMLVGKTGNGMTSAMNTLLGRPASTDQPYASSQTTECKTETAEFDGQKLVVIDTPGLMNTEKTQDEVKKDIAGCIVHASPGIHVFLLVLKGDRSLTTGDKDVMETIQMIFGDKSKNYTLALLTKGDKPVKLIKEDMEIINTYTVGHHSFDNNPPPRPKQVEELLEKINKMIQKNQEKLYTNEMLKKVEELKEEQKSDGMTEQDGMLRIVKDFFSKIMGEQPVELVEKFSKFIASKVSK